MPTALVSVSDKTGLIEFLTELRKLDKDYKFVATTSTATHLKENRIDCVTVESITKFPEILGGRVKTLHPNVFAGILARATTEDRATLKEIGLDEIDMVIVNLYPFEKKLKENLPEEKMIEQIDVGGPSMIRAAAKNFDRVAIACDPDQYKGIIEALQQNKGQLTKDFRRELAAQAFNRTMRYDTAINGYMAERTRVATAGETENGDTKAMPHSINVNLAQHQKLRYGENPHQSAVWYAPHGNQTSSDEISFPPFEQLQGKDMSSNNIVDTYALVKFLRELDDPAVCIIKHNNPCGVATGKTLADALKKAHDTDPMAVFGGIFGFTGEVDENLAKEITKDFIEIVAAPSYSAGAMEVFTKKKNVRVLKMKPGALQVQESDKWRARDLQDFGWIIERADEPPPSVETFDCVAGEFPKELTADIKFAWGIVQHLTSNAIFIAKDGCSLGFGIGQTSRIASVKIALEQAGENARGAVMASDAFFPATDNIDEAARAGIKVIVQPGGSIKDPDVIAACKEKGITMLFTGQRCFKH